MRILASVSVILSLFGVGAQEGRRLAKDYPKSGVYWSKTWTEATGEAWHRNVPIFIAIHKDGSEECTATASLFREKQFIEASRMWVNFIDHPGVAHDVDVEIDGKRVARCELYFDVTCKDHAEAEAQLPKLIQRPSSLPARVFYNIKEQKEQKELGREMGIAKLSDVIKSMGKIQAQIPGEKMSADVWRKGKALLAEGDQGLARKEWQKAIKAYRAALKVGGDFMQTSGNAGLNKINVQGELLYTEAFESQPKDGKGEFIVTKRKLRKIIEDFKSLPIEEKARAYLEGLEKHGH